MVSTEFLKGDYPMGLTMTVSNGTMSEISPYFSSNAKGDFDVEKEMEKLLLPVFQGLVPSVPITIQDNKEKLIQSKILFRM